MAGDGGVEAVLGRLVDLLDEAGLAYMLVGSFASSMHGEPRSTQDIDVVVAPDEAALSRFLQLLPENEYYVDEQTALRAVRARSMFNIIEMASVWKVDVILQKRGAHAEEAFERRVQGRVGEVELWVESAEDTIISKLRWARKGGGSERQLRDVAGIRKLMGPQLDLAYVERWVEELKLADLWGQTE